MAAPICRCCSRTLQLSSFDRPGVMTFGSRMPTMYLGVICEKCGAIECNHCKGSLPDAPCSRCGGTVSPAWEHLVASPRSMISPRVAPAASPMTLWQGIGIGVLSVAGLLLGAWAIWDVKKPDPPFLAVPGGEVTRIALSPDGRRALSGGADRSVRVWDVDAGREARQLGKPEGRVMWLAFHPDGRRAVSATDMHPLRLWDVETGKELRRYGLPDERPPDPSGAAMPALPGPARPPEPAQLPTVRPLPGRLTAAALTLDGGRLFATTGQTVYVWETETGRLVKQIDCLLESPSRPDLAALAADGQHAIGWRTTVDAGGKPDYSLYLVSVETGKELHRLEGHTGRLLAAVFTPDSRRVLTASMDNTLRLWDVATGKEVSQRPKPRDDEAGSNLTISPDGRLALLGGWTGSMFHVSAPIWDLSAGKELRSLRGHKKSVLGAAFSRDGKLVLTCGGDGGVRRWDVETGEQMRPR